MDVIHIKQESVKTEHDDVFYSCDANKNTEIAPIENNFVNIKAEHGVHVDKTYTSEEIQTMISRTHSFIKSSVNIKAETGINNVKYSEYFPNGNESEILSAMKKDLHVITEQNGDTHQNELVNIKQETPIIEYDIAEEPGQGWLSNAHQMINITPLVQQTVGMEETSNLGNVVTITEPYECAICNVKMQKSEELELHQQVHVSPYKCAVCGKKFNTAAGLNSHVKRLIRSEAQGKETGSDHRVRKPNQCCVCQDTYKGFHELESHIFSHLGEKPFHCLICHKRFAKLEECEYHHTTHIGYKQYDCFCGQTFGSILDLRYHSKQSGHIVKTPYKCASCSEEFQNIDSLNIHFEEYQKNILHNNDKMLTCKRNSLPRSGKSSRTARKTVSNYAKSRTTFKKAAFMCGVCPATYMHASTLDDHVRLHFTEVLCQCGVCGEKFASYDKLMVHLIPNTVHNYPPGYSIQCECLKCHTSFPTFSRLAIHGCKIINIWPKICAICGAKHSCIGALHEHLSCVENYKKHICMCHQVFGDAMECQEHAAVTGHVVDIKQTLHKCAICNDRFQNTEMLEFHVSSKHPNGHLGYLQSTKQNNTTTLPPCTSNTTSVDVSTGDVIPGASNLHEAFILQPHPHEGKYYHYFNVLYSRVICLIIYISCKKYYASHLNLS